MGIVAYWAGYLSQASVLQDTPQPLSNFSAIIPAFFGPTLPGSAVETTFINSFSHFSNQELGAGLGYLAANQPDLRITLSFLDTPQVHWDNPAFNPTVFVSSVFNLVNSWSPKVRAQLHFDIDLETGGSFAAFIPLIKALAAGLENANITGPRIRLVGYTGSAGEQAAVQCACDIGQFEGLSTMDYYNPAFARVALVQEYLTWIEPYGFGLSQICVLGKAPIGDDSGTPIEVMQQVVQTLPGVNVGVWPLPYSYNTPSVNTYVAQLVVLQQQSEQLKAQGKALPPKGLLCDDPRGGHRVDIEAAAAGLSTPPSPVLASRGPGEEENPPLSEPATVSSYWNSCTLS